MTFPSNETAKLIRAYAGDILSLEMGDGEPGAYGHLLEAIIRTDATTSDACCHLGNALILIEDGLADPPYRLGGAMCDPRKSEIALRLGMLDLGPDPLGDWHGRNE